MSYWHEIKKEDIELSDDGKELEVHIRNDNSGAVYITLKIEDILEKLKDLNKLKA